MNVYTAFLRNGCENGYFFLEVEVRCIINETAVVFSDCGRFIMNSVSRIKVLVGNYLIFNDEKKLLFL